MSAITSHLVRRGLEATSNHLSPITNNDNEDRRQLSGWAMLVFGVTAVVFGFIAFAVCASLYICHADRFHALRSTNT